MGPRTDAFAGECESVLHNFTIFHLMLVSCRHRRRRQRRRDVCLINCHLFDVSLRAAGTQPGRSAQRRHSCWLLCGLQGGRGRGRGREVAPRLMATKKLKAQTRHSPRLPPFLLFPVTMTTKRKRKAKCCFQWIWWLLCAFRQEIRRLRWPWGCRFSACSVAQLFRSCSRLFACRPFGLFGLSRLTVASLHCVLSPIVRAVTASIGLRRLKWFLIGTVHAGGKSE